MGKAEATVEGYLITVAKAKGATLRKAAWIARRGCPDRFVMTANANDLNFWVETKSAAGKLEPHQEREIALMIAHGEVVYVVSTREEVDRLPWGRR